MKRRQIMNMTIRQLVVASTVALATAAVSAQSTSTTTPTTRKAEPATQAERDFESAKAACQTQRSRTARFECLRHAEDTYNRATGTTMAPLSGAGGSASGTQQNGSARARS
jgi:hypothetical protein